MKILLSISCITVLFSYSVDDVIDKTLSNSTTELIPQDTTKKLILSESEWKKRLDSIEFNVLRKKGTEHAYTGKYWDHYKKGTYQCRGCNLPLFLSSTKFKSGTGWPSFTDKIASNVKKLQDHSLGIIRSELICNKCNGHLGHVFNDGPQPTGLRYCINSASLQFTAE